MNNKLPDCPRCDEDELYRLPGKETKIRCYSCNWDSGLLGIDLDDSEEDEAIAVAVSEYRLTRSWGEDGDYQYYSG